MNAEAYYRFNDFYMLSEWVLDDDSNPFCAGLQKYTAKLLFCMKSFKTVDSWHNFSLMFVCSLPGIP